jgi:hypothetical protein
MGHSLLLGPAAFLVAGSLLSEDVSHRAEELNAAYWRCEAQAGSPGGLAHAADQDLLLTWRAFHRALAEEARPSSALRADRRTRLEETLALDAQLLQVAAKEGAFKTWKAHRDELTAMLVKPEVTMVEVVPNQVRAQTGASTPAR